MHWSIYAFIEVVWVVVVAVWIILERRSPASTLAWILALALMPAVGVIVYLLLGPRRLRRKLIRHTLAREAIAVWSGGRQLGELDIARPDDSRLRSIAEVAANCGEAPPLRADELRVLFDGDECFSALLAEVERAERYIHLEYYIFDPDEWGRRLTEALVEKAKAGVEVRLLADAFGSNRLGSRFLRPLREAGAEVAFFNSLRLARFRPRLANFRTHRKIAVVDGRTALTGGMNIADIHSVELSGDDAWRDTHLYLTGDPVLPLQLVFLEDWQYATGAAPSGERYLPRPTLAGTGPFVQIVAGGPDQDAYPIHEVYLAALGRAERRAWLTTPYFVPDEPLLAAITGAARRGVDVRLLLPDRPDHILVRQAARSFYPDVLRAGVRLHVYDSPMIHAKTLVVDDDVSIVGTANLDNRSFRLNFEVIALIFGEEPAGLLAGRFLEDAKRAGRLGPWEDADAPPLHRRLAEGAARLFSAVL